MIRFTILDCRFAITMLRHGERKTNHEQLMITYLRLIRGLAAQRVLPGAVKE